MSEFWQEAAAKLPIRQQAAENLLGHQFPRWRLDISDATNFRTGYAESSVRAISRRLLVYFAICQNPSGFFPRSYFNNLLANRCR